MIEITTEQRDALLRLIERDLRSTAKGRADLIKRFGERANTAALDEWAATLEAIRPALSDEAEIMLAVEGWWHHNAQSGKVHDHPEQPGRNWSEPMHRLCQPVYTLRPTSASPSLASALSDLQRCEDAPCCGHVRCGFGPGVPGYGSMVNDRPYYGETS